MSGILKSCPFCGNNEPRFVSYLQLYASEKVPHYQVRCDRCGARTDISRSRELAIEAWNRRDNRNAQEEAK